MHLNFSVASDTPAYIFAQKSDGTNFRISKTDLANALKSDLGISGGGSSSVDTDALYDGCFIMFHDSIDNIPYAVSYADWADFWSNSEEADGVLIIEGGHSVLVAPHEKTCHWSSKVGTATTTVVYSNENRIRLLDTWDGMQRIYEICESSSSPFKSESTTSTYAPGYCYNYSPHGRGSEVNGLKNQDYWLPCIAELMMIYTHLHKINAGLKLIPGAQPFSNSWYWSSTESNDEYVWGLYLGDGEFQDSLVKISDTNIARPVSAFIHNGFFEAL